MMASPHFVERVAQRIGGHVDAAVLFRDLSRALADPDANHAFIEFVIPSHSGSSIWRFLLDGAVYYVVAKGPRPVTIYTQDQVRRVKETRKVWKFRRKKNGRT
jgi:hypothetical protein